MAATKKRAKRLPRPTGELDTGYFHFAGVITAGTPGRPEWFEMVGPKLAIRTISRDEAVDRLLLLLSAAMSGPK